MNVYVESNFVLELAFVQEEHGACEEILRACESGRIRLILPAYSLMEPVETARRRQINHERLREDLEDRLRELTRSEVYKTRIPAIRRAGLLLVEGSADDVRRLQTVRSRVLGCAELIPLERSILGNAVGHQDRHELSVQDSVVYASVLSHLERTGEPACFLSRDVDFNTLAIKGELAARSCRLISRFETGLQFIRRPPPEGTR
ncbi:MAG: PIN domain-containing protein [Thermoanaerobaculia bacterium]